MSTENPSFIDTRFLDRLFASPRGRAFMIGFMADAEDSDERGVFDTLLERVEDPQLHKMIRIHRDDEIKHASMLRGCLSRMSIPRAVPDHLRIIPYLERELGNVTERFLDARGGVMEAYVFLQVVEERAVLQFPLFAEAVRPYDPETAKTIDAIVEDEKRHVKYAKAISKKYAPDETTLARTLAKFRAAEAKAHVDHGATFLSFALDEDLLAVGRVEKLIWRAMSKLPAAA
jgi:rubrerythrin